MARIALGGGWVLKSDATSWGIVREVFNRKKGTTYDDPLGYYSTLEGAFQGLVEMRLRFSDADSLAELRAELERVKLEISEFFGSQAEWLWIEANSHSDQTEKTPGPEGPSVTRGSPERSTIPND